MLLGLGLTLLLALASIWLGQMPAAHTLGLSTLTIAIILGMLLGNTLYPPIGPRVEAGVNFSKAKVLRAGIILYGFRLTWGQLAAVGVHGLVSAALMLTTTFVLAYWVGRRLGLERETTLLIGAGASICGAAAVLATAPILKAKAEQITVAVATVVVFGTVGIFLYPAMYAWGIWPFTGSSYGMYIGSSVHEVAQVVAAGKAISAEIADAAVTTKMIRVMLLAPFLILLSAWWNKNSAEAGGKRNIQVPWFAVGFIAVALFNSLHLLPQSVVAGLLTLDNLLLTMAMAALGLTTQLGTLKQAGVRPLLLGFGLMLWLVLGGGTLQMLWR